MEDLNATAGGGTAQPPGAIELPPGTNPEMLPEESDIAVPLLYAQSLKAVQRALAQADPAALIEDLGDANADNETDLFALPGSSNLAPCYGDLGRGRGSRFREPVWRHRGRQRHRSPDVGHELVPKPWLGRVQCREHRSKLRVERGRHQEQKLELSKRLLQLDEGKGLKGLARQRRTRTCLSARRTIRSDALPLLYSVL